MPRPSPERFAVAWAKANGPISGIVGEAAATRLPNQPPMPFLRVFLIDGAPDGEASIDTAQLQFDCYDVDDAGADVLYRTLVDQLEASNHVTNSHGYGYGWQVISTRRSPEPDTKRGRFTVLAGLTLRPGS